MIVCLCNALNEEKLKTMQPDDYLKIKQCGKCEEMVMDCIMAAQNKKLDKTP